MSSREFKERRVEELMKMDKAELLNLANHYFSNWVRSTVELQQCYKEGNVNVGIEKGERAINK